MENELNEDIITSENNDEELVEIEEETPELVEKPEKKEETPEARLARLKRQTAQLEKKLGVEKPKVEEVKKSGEIDYGQKAFLVANGIKGAEEVKLVQQYQDSGRSLDEILDESTVVGRIFQAELKEMRETKTTREAIPQGSKRSTPTEKGVDYWLTKPFSEVPADKREAVLNAKIKQSRDNSMFSDNPIV